MGWLLVLVATSPGGAEDRYLVPAVERQDRFDEPRDGEGVWARLAGMIATDGELGAGAGRFRFRSVPALAALTPSVGEVASQRERRLRVEQSNTSIVLGDRLILKVYRLLEPGRNPEVEVGEFLTSAGFAGTPTMGGVGEYRRGDAAPSPALLLQQFVASESDAWNWVQRCLTAGPGSPADAVAGLAEMGTLTREMHLALASRPDVEGFPSRTATPQELAGWQASAEGQLESALASVEGEMRNRLGAAVPHIRERLGVIGTASSAPVTRIHGDFHLGQLLRTAGGFTVIDFGGEPARPLEERLAPGTPLRDVAGMLRSIDYAAQVAHRARGLLEPEHWVEEARQAFIGSYAGGSALDRGLLDAFEIEKACYEVRYEANNRPDWVWLPIGALERLTAQIG